MKLGITKFVIVAAIAVLAVVSGSTAAWAAEVATPCPASPNYTPDFSSEPAPPTCLTVNGAAALASPASSTTPPVGTPNPAQAAPSGVNQVLRLTPNSTFLAGSAWFNNQQPVAAAFSTTFTFQLSDTVGTEGDGIAFVIQNSSLAALDPDTGGTDGCSLGYGDDPANTGCTSATGGIPSSLAVEFDTFQNTDDPNANHVAIQSCGTAANSSDNLVNGVLGAPGPCNIAINPLTGLTLNGAPITITLADGNIHTVTITYTPSNLTSCGTVPSGPQAPLGSQPGTPGDCSSIDVILDGVDLFPGGVLVDLSTLLNLPNTNNLAFVGFTGATGGADEDNDILSWTFMPGAQSGTVTTGAETILNFEGGFGNGINGNGYDANAQLTTGSPQTVQVNPIQGAAAANCTELVRTSFPGAQCVGYNNSTGTASPSYGPVMFEYTCPGSATGGTCGSVSVGPSGIDFFATLGTDLYFDEADNPMLFSYNSLPTPGYYVTPLPLIGWLKGAGPDPLNPCTPNPGNSPALFQSNQISSFTDPAKSPASGTAKGSSGGTGSCWVLTYNTPNEAPSASIAAPTIGSTFQQGQTVYATFTCNTVNEGASSPVGPYLTLNSCTLMNSYTGVGSPASYPASFGAGAASVTYTTTTPIDTTSLGTHTLTATVVDSATNTVSSTPVTYNVVAATNVAIQNSASNQTTPGSKLTYVITAWDSGPANAVNTLVTDTLAPGTTFVSASGVNIGLPCTTVGGKTSCKLSYTPITCMGSALSSVVTCPVGTIMPISLFDLNGAVIEVTVLVNQQGTKQNPTKLSNTATVTQSNAETKQDNSSTAVTTVN
jgi:uncharacterized repeat protein (TIGR01451 family)